MQLYLFTPLCLGVERHFAVRDIPLPVTPVGACAAADCGVGAKRIGARDQPRQVPALQELIYPSPATLLPSLPSKGIIISAKRGSRAFIFLSTAHLGLKVSLLGCGEYVG